MVAAIFLISSCGNKKKEIETVTEGTTPASRQLVPNLKINEDKLNAVYEQYKSLRTALVEGDVTRAKIASNAIEAGLKEMPGGANLKFSASRITAAPDVQTQRTAFASLSGHMIALVKDAGVSNGEVYVGFCPMALDNKGASWLTEKKEVINPYFGDEMLKCGEIKETIN